MSATESKDETSRAEVNIPSGSYDPESILNSTLKTEEMENKTEESSSIKEQELRGGASSTADYEYISMKAPSHSFFSDFDAIKNQHETTVNSNVCESDKGPCCEECYEKLRKVIERTTDMIEMLVTTLDSHSKSMSGNKTGIDESHDYFLPPKAKRKHRVAVEIKCTFLKIMDINTIAQKFGAELFVQAKWEEPDLRDKTYEEYKTFIEDHKIEEFIPWEPQLTVVNTEGTLDVSKKTYDVQFQVPGHKYPVVLQLWRFKGTFKETLELQHFPFDVQDLTISISAERSEEELELIEDRRSMCSINTEAFMDIQEWDIFQHVETFQDITTVEYCSATVHPILHVQCRVARQVGYFVWNVVFIVVLMFSISFTTFTIEAFSPDRLLSTITLFLTAVAFKLVVQQSLPKISYLTYLDMYILAAMIYLTIQSGQNAVVAELSHAGNEDLLKLVDRWTMLSLSVLFIVAHIVFIIFIRGTARKRRRIMEYKDKVYKEKKQFLSTFGSIPREEERGWDERDHLNPNAKNVLNY